LATGSSRDAPRRHRESDFLDVLRGGGEQALAGDGEKPPEPGVAMAVKLFGVGEGALHGLLAALVDPLAPGSEAMGIDAFARSRPDMAGDQAGGVAARGARGEPRKLLQIVGSLLSWR
jgi:hypothetical protein